MWRGRPARVSVNEHISWKLCDEFSWAEALMPHQPSQNVLQ